MTFSLDSNIIFDLIEFGFKPSSPTAIWSKNNFVDALKFGPVIVSIVVFAEVSPAFESAIATSNWLKNIGIMDILSPSLDALHMSGLAHARYRKNGGVRDRTLPDFIIGADALDRSVTLITRDPARYRTYFPDLKLIAPDL